MKLIKATYGDVDVSHIVQSKINNGNIYFIVSNSLFGDTKIGTLKYLDIEVEQGGVIFKDNVVENSVFSFPRTSYDRLGIFYSCNINDKIRPCILTSLKSIQTAAQNKVDIITNMWNHEPENPFVETIAKTKTYSHLNQTLQILQLLYTAKSIKNYRYVSFLECDVLYSENYFDYPDFEENVICNMNYMGINKDGFQKLIQKDRATSQLTMKFEYAIEHFMSLLPNALVTNNGNLEPNCEMKIYESTYPNMHINHGYHFTSHYNVYSKTELEKSHPYWGDHQKYKNLFF